MILSSALKVLLKCFKLAEYSQSIAGRGDPQVRLLQSMANARLLSPFDGVNTLAGCSDASTFALLSGDFLNPLKGVDDGGVIHLSPSGIEQSSEQCGMHGAEWKWNSRLLTSGKNQPHVFGVLRQPGLRSEVSR